MAMSINYSKKKMKKLYEILMLVFEYLEDLKNLIFNILKENLASLDLLRIVKII